MKQGHIHLPIFDHMTGAFCWFRMSDQKATLWETGDDAQRLYEFCLTASPADIDQKAASHFDADEI